MKKKPSLFEAEKKPEKFIIKNREAFYAYLDELKEGEYLLDVISVKEERTKAQNRMIHHLASVVADHTGDDVDFFKEIWKQAFIGTEKVHNPILMRTVERGKSTSDLSVEESAKFIDDIIKWVIENFRFNPKTLEVFK